MVFDLGLGVVFCFVIAFCGVCLFVVFVGLVVLVWLIGLGLFCLGSFGWVVFDLGLGGLFWFLITFCVVCLLLGVGLLGVVVVVDCCVC